MAYEIQKVNALGAMVPTIMPFVANAAIAKGAAAGFSGGKLVLATADVRPVCLTLEEATAGDQVISCELIGPTDIIKAHCTGAPTVGLIYDFKSDGLEIDQGDTTDYKAMVLEYDSATGYALAMIVNYAQKT